MRRLVLCLLAAAPAATIAQTTPGIPAPTSDWGCEVLLCLANPSGPTAVSECEPPIRRLWRHLARGKPFPTCTMASGPNGSSFAQVGHSHYDPCPAGTTALGWGERAQLAAPTLNVVPSSATNVSTKYVSAAPGLTYVGIGTGDGLSTGSDNQAPAKACAAGFKGRRQVWTSDGNDNVALYETILTAPPQASPRFIDVYIDNRFQQRVRW